MGKRIALHGGPLGDDAGVSAGPWCRACVGLRRAWPGRCSIKTCWLNRFLLLSCLCPGPRWRLNSFLSFCAASRGLAVWKLTSPCFSLPGIPASHPAERGGLSGEGPDGGERQGGGPGPLLSLLSRAFLLPLGDARRQRGGGGGFAPLGDARRGRRGGGGCVHPTSSWLCPTRSLPPLAPCGPWRPLGPVSGPCWGSVRRTRPRTPTLSSGFFSPCSVQPSCLPASSHGGPWLGAGGKSLPKCPWEPGTSSCLPGSPGPCPALGIECEAERMSNWVQASSWLWLWGVSGGSQ